MGLRLYKIIPNSNSRGPLIIPTVPSFSKRQFAKYKIMCNFSKALLPGAIITNVTARASDKNGAEVTSTIIDDDEISSIAQEVNVVVKAGVVALSPISIYVQVSTADEQSELEITMTISADTKTFGLQMAGDVQMVGNLQME